MRLSQRLIAATVLVSLSCVLAGCGGGGVSSFDPMDMLDFLDTKKKLPGERKDVFPQGVPGVEQGVPKELYRGAQAQPDAPPVAEQPPAAEPKARSGAKKPARAASTPSAAPDEATPDAAAEDAAPATPPAPKAAKRKKHVSPTAIPREEPAPAPAAQAPSAPPPLQQQQSPPAFPAPLPSGSFSR